METSRRADGGALLDEPAAGSPSAATDAGEEARSGLTPRQQRVAALLNQLTTTARSFLLYDARNAAVHRFIETLLIGLESFLEEEGPLALEVRPLEIWFEGRSVYFNKDRERSLAFRLYRDGVRGLSFEPGFGWEELARLLEILSVRYTGIHQHEDDTVTLLWKAGFDHLETVAVEGFAEVEEGSEEGSDAPAWDLGGPPRDEAGELPDLPRPAVGQVSGPAWHDVPETVLAALRSEVSAASLPQECLALLIRLLEEMDDPRHLVPFAEAQHLFTEVRDFLLGDETLPLLVGYMELLADLAQSPAPAHDPSRPAAAAEILRSCGDQRALGRLLHSVAAEERHLKPELVRVLDLACPDPVPAIVEALAHEQGQGSRAVARQLLEHYEAGRLEELHRRFAEARGATAADLLRVLGHLGGEAASELVAAQCTHPDHEVREEALVQLERRKVAPAALRLVLDAFRSVDGAERPRLLALLARSGERRFVEPLLDFVSHSRSGLDAELASEIGLVVGHLAAGEMPARVREWLQPAGLRGRRLGSSTAEAVAGAFALAEQPGDEAARLLRSALVAAGAECHDWIGRALARHARSARPR